MKDMLALRHQEPKS